MTAPGSSALRVLVVDDHFLARFALVEFLATQSGIEVVGQAEDGVLAVEQVRQLMPDVVVMDLVLPRLDGVGATEAIVRTAPSCRVLIVSNLDREEDLHKAVRAGARGYLRKDVEGDVLVEAIRRVHKGERYFPSDLALKVAERALQPSLTGREREVLAQMCAGKINRDIADALGVKESTVRIYISSIFIKLGVKRRAEAITAAVRKGLVQP